MIDSHDRALAPDVQSPQVRQFRAAVLAGLRAPVKSLPCQYFYDEAGSELFERITRLPEYYPTRTELAIMDRHAPEMADLLGRDCLLVEYGSGSSAKTRRLLDHARDLAGYVPIDVSEEFLGRSAQALAKEYPQIPVLPVCADFAGPVQLPAPPGRVLRRVVYFPGSTIGNFTPAETVALLRRTAQLCGPGGGLLLGADLRKDRRVIEAAYNDSQGVTAAFNLNILARINRELGGNFAMEQFEHLAFYNVTEGRIEMHLVSRRPQRVHVAGEDFFFTAGESICTEYSYKYTLQGLRRFAETAGFDLSHIWMDKRKYFSVCYLAVV
jgi:dimethylhistidine N-methyltransferase